MNDHSEAKLIEASVLFRPDIKKTHFSGHIHSYQLMSGIHLMAQ